MFWAILSLVLPVTFGHVTACRSAALAFSPAIHFVMNNSAPCFAVLCHSSSSWATIVHLSGWMPKTLRSYRRHPTHSFYCPPAEPAPPTSSPSITHSGSLVSSMRATNPANRIRLLRSVASMLSLPVFTRVSVGDRVVGAIVLSPSDAAGQEAVVGSAQRVVVTRARAPPQLLDPLHRMAKAQSHRPPDLLPRPLVKLGSESI